jgi:hypothetical protein
MSDDEREAVRLVLVMAPSFQGGHSKTAVDVCRFLGIEFPVRMPKLAAARARGFDPDELWPWWKKVRDERLQALHTAARGRREAPSDV